jgi:hypothetical protein
VLVNARLTTRRTGAEVAYRDLDAAGLEQSLTEDFGLPMHDSFRPLFAEITASTR